MIMKVSCEAYAHLFKLSVTKLYIESLKCEINDVIHMKPMRQCFSEERRRHNVTTLDELKQKNGFKYYFLKNVLFLFH